MIEAAREGACLTLTLNRPEKANALTREMLVSLTDAVGTAGRDDTCKVVVLTGAGKVFSAGADLDAARAGLATDPVWELLSGAVAALPCLTIAALNGTAAGGSMGMVLACDLRVAVPEAKLFYPVMKLGFLPQPSDPVRLRALVGPARAKLILMGGAKVTADEALTMGLVDRVTPDVLGQAQALAGNALAAERGHVQAIKRMA